MINLPVDAVLSNCAHISRDTASADRNESDVDCVTRMLKDTRAKDLDSDDCASLVSGTVMNQLTHMSNGFREDFEQSKKLPESLKKSDCQHVKPSTASTPSRGRLRRRGRPRSCLCTRYGCPSHLLQNIKH